MKFNLAKLFLTPRRLNVVDPMTFNDPVATSTQWTPKVRGGSSYWTHELKEISDSRMEYQAMQWSIFLIIFIVLTVFLPTVALLGPMVNETGLSDILAPENRPFLLYGGGALTIAVITITLVLLQKRTVVFDKSYGVYWKTNKLSKTEGGTLSPMSDKNTSLADIHALQIIGERVSSDNHSFDSFELNLVKRDASRENLVDHAQVARIREEALKLGLFLGVPVWDATAGYESMDPALANMPIKNLFGKS